MYRYISSCFNNLGNHLNTFKSWFNYTKNEIYPTSCIFYINAYMVSFKWGILYLLMIE